MKKRLDELLVEKGLISGRDKAKAIIMAGHVYLDGQKADKPGLQVNSDANIDLRHGVDKYVSRGGLKLEKAVSVFGLSLDGLICMDIGASTGGFTDCMLQNGATKVYAVDVGYGQLAWRLRSDSRVVVMERTNIRHLTRETLSDDIDFISVDVSFISLKLVLPAARALIKDDGEMVCLIKPQFEAGRGSVGKKGVIRDEAVHLSVVRDITGFSSEHGFSVLGVDFSPIKGPAGNIEYLMHIKKTETPENISPESIERSVRLSHLNPEGL